jgi:superfamily II DNA or RNA helicase
MSGSVDQAGDVRTSLHDRLQSSVGPLLAEYTILDGQRDGIIPSFTWEILYAGYTEATDLRAATRGLEDAVAEFREDVEAGHITLPSGYSAATFDEIRRFARTNEASELRQQDPAFDALSRRLMARRTIRWNVGPQPRVVEELLSDAADNLKAVVLTQSRKQVQEIMDLLNLKRNLAVFELNAEEAKSDQLATISAFDDAAGPAVIVGTGSLLGEGIDMQSANLAINLATGKVSPALVQRIGRVLRKPEGANKHAHFINIVGVPALPAETVPAEDGRHLLELAAEFCGLGSRFNELPRFSSATNVDGELLQRILDEGDESFKTLQTHYPGLVELVGVSEKYYTALRKRLDATFAATLDAWNAYTHSESTRLPELIETNPPEAPRNEAMITNQIKGAYEWLRDTMR